LKATCRLSPTANDRHTLAGLKLGRGLDHFRKEGAKLIPEPTEPDLYVEKASQLCAIKQQGKQQAKAADLLDE
jgi:hypothetical protein